MSFACSNNSLLIHYYIARAVVKMRSRVKSTKLLILIEFHSLLVIGDGIVYKFN